MPPKEVVIIKSPVSWMGSKTSILHILYALFPLSYGRYIEPFSGSDAVLLGKAVPDKFEVYNDYNANLVNLFRCMRDRPMEFIHKLGFLNLNARDDFLILKHFFEKQDFTDEFLKQELDLTSILLPAPNAAEIRLLYKTAKEEYDLRRAVMFLNLVRYSYIQRIERPLMTSDELKSMPKGQFVGMKTSFYPMKVKLKLFFK